MSEQPSNRDNRRIFPITSSSCRLVRILCFDAGGAGCVSSLAILRKIMHPGPPGNRTSPDGPVAPEPDNLYPCRHFELFCGSEWGAVLAIMLGRLRMSIQECQAWFSKPEVIHALHLHELSWIQRNVPGGVRKYMETRSTDLSNAFKELLGDKAQEPFRESGDDVDLESKCRTLVLATNLDSMNSPAMFASYLRGPQDTYSILDVMMAAVAIPEQTLPVTLTPQRVPAATRPNMECISASLTGHANPCLQALIEAEDQEWTIHSLLSIGCGIRNWARSEGWGRSNDPRQQLADAAEVTGRIATDTERIEVQVRRLCNRKIDYGRFNLPDGVVSEDVGDWNWTLTPEFRAKIDDYLSDKTVDESLRVWHEQLGIPNTIHPLPLNTPSTKDYCPFDTLDLEKKLSTNDEKKMDKWMTRFQEELHWFVRKEPVPKTNKVKAIILDTGIDATHPDIQELWGVPGDDNEKEEWLKQRYWDFTTDRDDQQPNQGQPQDECGHGTHTAGIFLQIASNVDLYVARVMRGATIRVDGSVIAQRISSAVTCAAEHSIKILCLAIGLTQRSRPIENAIVKAMQKTGCVVFAAAGNNGKQDPTCYPARSPYVIAVRSADAFGVESTFNPPPLQGRNFAFPGERVASMWPAHLPPQGDAVVKRPEGMTGVWRRMSGTSAATPIAAATAAQVLHFCELKRAAAELGDSLSGVGALFEMQSVLLEMGAGRVGDSVLCHCKGAHQVFVQPWNVLGHDWQHGGALRKVRHALEQV